MNRAWRRQAPAEWASRAVTDFCDKNRAWTPGWRRLRAHNDEDFRDAVTEAAALHARDEFFAAHITPEPAEEVSLVSAMAEELEDDEDGTPPYADADELGLIDRPPAPGISTSDVLLGAVHRTASGVGRWTALTPPKFCHLHRIPSAPK